MTTPVNLHLVDPTELTLHVQDSIGLVRHRQRYSGPANHFERGTPVIIRLVFDDPEQNGATVTRYAIQLGWNEENEEYDTWAGSWATLHEAVRAFRKDKERRKERGPIAPPVLRVRAGVWMIHPETGKPITFIPWKDIHPDVLDEQSPWYIEGLAPGPS